MKVLDRLNELELFGKEPVNVENAVSFLYTHRIYMSDLLDEDIPKDLQKVVENFLDSVIYFDGDQSELWLNFLRLEYETLLRMEEFM